MKDNKERLEAAALNTVQRGGLSGLSFRTLGDEIGIKSSSVHYYFPEKSDLTRTLIERYTEHFFESLNTISSKNWNLRRKVSAFIGIFEQVAEQEKLCLCGMAAAEMEQLNDENRLLLKAFFRNTEQWLTNLLNQHSDELISSVNTKKLAKYLLSGLEGALLLDRIMGDKNRLNAQKELFLSLIKA